MRLVNPVFAGVTANAYGLADTVQQFPLGTRMYGIESDPSTVANVLNGGGGEFVYMQSGAAHAVGAAIDLTSNTWTTAALAATANASNPIGIAANRFTAAAQFGWVQVAGQAPIVNNGTFAAGANVFKQAAGVLSTTVLAGGQVLGMRSTIAAAATFTKSVKVRTGSAIALLQAANDLSGVFAGLTVSGTGIPGATTILDQSPGDGSITMSANATAGGVITMTFTYTLLGAVSMSYPHGQGQIT
jgi:hypothetical protein